MVIQLVVAGFFSAFGWWGANKYVIEPHFEKPKPKVDQSCCEHKSDSKTD